MLIITIKIQKSRHIILILYDKEKFFLINHKKFLKTAFLIKNNNF